MMDDIGSAHVKGPLVWLDMDQKELDDAYTQSVYAPNQALVHSRNRAAVSRMIERIGEPERFAYGPSPIEGMDVYKTSVPKAPVFVYVHGGAWRNGINRDSAFPAEMLVTSGAHYVGLDFALVQDVGGNLLTVAGQIRQALAWVAKNAERFGGDPDRIYVGGHSSGAHMTGVLLTTDWSKYGLPQTVIKGGTVSSGMFDLTPVRLSVRSSYVNFTDETVEDLSAMRHLDRLVAPVVVAHGDQETPEFQRQSREFASAVKNAGKPLSFSVGVGYNHFEIFETFGNPYGLIGYQILKQMKLKE